MVRPAEVLKPTSITKINSILEECSGCFLDSDDVIEWDPYMHRGAGFIIKTLSFQGEGCNVSIMFGIDLGDGFAVLSGLVEDVHSVR